MGFIYAAFRITELFDSMALGALPEMHIEAHEGADGRLLYRSSVPPDKAEATFAR